MCNTLQESSTHVDVEFNYDKVDIDDNDNYDNNVKEESDNDIEDKKNKSSMSGSLSSYLKQI